MSNNDATIIERLTRVEEKIDNFLDRVAHSHTRMDDHESRIRALEKSGAKLLGMGTLLAAASGIAAPRLLQIFVGG
ncbi:hypothetical protein [Novosphingobium clariflavum]|uniref:Uncharacterized protein n=1 Tax=Novosphingobium clariflavum TaxID=2029884 RepID=A0ABV6SB44_9SPHN|nr:hypothetical protein [Novosphingobium clariflavum]